MITLYQVIKVIQYLGIIALAFGMIYIYPKKRTKSKELLVLLIGSVLINQLGYALELGATTKDAALVAIRIAYVGKLTVEPFIVLLMLHYGDMRVPKWLKPVLFGVNAVILALVWTCEHHTLYYSKIGFTKEGLFPHVTLEHGIIYNLFTVTTFVYVLIMVGICAYQWRKATNEKERTKWIWLGCNPILFIVGLIVFKAGITQGYDCTSLAYVCCAFVLIYALRRFDIIDQKEVAKDVILDEFGEPVIVVDDYVVIYRNAQFKENFKKIFNKKTGASVNKILAEWIEKKEFKYQSRFYRIVEKNVLKDSSSAGVIYIFHDVTEELQTMDLLNNYAETLERDVQEKTKHIIEMKDKMVLGMADMVENRDANTGGHIKRTSHGIRIFMEAMKRDSEVRIDDTFCTAMIKAAPMHDLGKIAVDDAILRKPGKFLPEEFEIMKTHAAKGAEIVRQLLVGVDDTAYFAKLAENIAHYHHERYDGSGYPCQLKGEEIPLEARIMAILDVYDALVSKRCYKDRMSFEDAFQIIQDGMGTQFDEKLNPYFLSCRKQLEEYYAGVEE